MRSRCPIANTVDPSGYRTFNSFSNLELNWLNRYCLQVAGLDSGKTDEGSVEHSKAVKLPRGMAKPKLLCSYRKTYEWRGGPW